MVPNESGGSRNPVERLADEYLERRRRGERPTPQEYAERWPEHAEEILELFPALELLERLKPSSDETEHTGPSTLASQPQRLGDYRILRMVGYGGMGVVYEAVQESLGRQVALKILPGFARRDAVQYERFQLEARLAARLHHTNIVPVYGVGEDQGVLYYAMQYIAGHGLEVILGDLRRLRGIDRQDTERVSTTQTATHRGAGSLQLARSLLSAGLGEGATDGAGMSSSRTQKIAQDVDPTAPRPPEVRGDAGEGSVALSDAAQGGYYHASARIGLQVAEALAHAHHQGVLHRDIKPSNLLLDAEGRVWVTDFGLAKLEGSDGPTAPGDVVGTLRYMAPERFEGSSDPRSDVYSLGATLYELVTLHPAFGGASRAELVEQVLHTLLVPPRRHDPAVPRDLETVVLKAMAKDPADRYPSAHALADDLRRFLEDRSIQARRPRPWERAGRWCRRNPAVATLLALVAGLTMTLAAGATVAAVRLKRANNAATARLWESYRAEATARRSGRQPGRRFAALEALSRAAAIRTDAALRDELIASLSVVDLRPVRSFPGVVAGHGSVALDEALERYAMSDRSGRILIRRTADDRELMRLAGRGVGTDWIRFAPGGRQLAVKYQTEVPHALVIWDLETGRSIASLPCSSNNFAFSADGRHLAALEPDGSIALRQAATGALVRRISCGDPVDQLAFHPGGRFLAATTGVAGTVRVFDVETGDAVWSAPLFSRARALAWSDDGRLLAAGGNAYRIAVWDFEKRTPLSSLEGHHNVITDLGFTPRDNLLFSTAWDNTTKLWDPVQGTILVELPGTFLQAGPGQRVGLLDAELSAGLWEVASRRECRALHHGLVGNVMARADIDAVDIHPEGRLMASAAQDGVRLWDIANGRELAHLDIDRTESVGFSADGTRMLTFGPAGLRVWPVSPSTEGRQTLGPPRRLDHTATGSHTRAVWGGEGRLIAAIDGRAQQAVVWDVERGVSVFTSGIHEKIHSIALSPDGRWLATATFRGRDIKLWDVQAGVLARVWPAEHARVAFSPDGRWFAATTWSDEPDPETGLAGRYQVWRVGSWEPGPRGRTQHDLAYATFRHDGSVLAFTQDRGQTRLVDPATSRVVASLDASPDMPGRVLALAYSRDGHRLAEATSAGAILLWDLRLLRQELRAWKLDWPGPPEPRDDCGNPSVPPFSLAVEGAGWFAPARFGEWMAAQGRWSDAAAAYAAAAALGPDDLTVWHRHLLLRIKEGDLAGYRRDCAAARARFREDPWPGRSTQLAWLCALAPDALPDYSTLIEPLTASARDWPGDPFILKALGAVLYRAGRYDDAERKFDECISVQRLGGTVVDWLFVAMIHKRQGHVDQARTLLAKSTRWLRDAEHGKARDPRLPFPWPLETRLELEVLRHEAETLIGEVDVPPTR
jgi:serine/threonine protein kinase/WD40 repeat protein